MKLKKKVKKEFEEKFEHSLTFDTNQLEVNAEEKKAKWPRHLIGVLVASVLICAIGVPVTYAILDKEDNDDIWIGDSHGDYMYEESFSLEKRDYSIHEAELINSSSFKNLNTVQTFSESRKNKSISEAYRSAFHAFTNTMYHQMNKSDNLAFSPMGLYSLLHLLSYGTSQTDMDALLGLNQAAREQDYIHMLQNNNFSTDTGTIQFSNSVFLTNRFPYQQPFVNHMTDNYTEAYQLDFMNNADVNKMLDWTNQKMNAENFLQRKDLRITEETAFYMFSALYFNNQWLHKFATSSSYENDFHLANQKTVKATYMTNSYYGDVYDYGDFVSCFNYYANGLKIEYFVPKTTQNNIYDLTQDFNFFDKSMATHITDCIVDLSVPRFSTETFYDFSDTLKQCGLEKYFDSMQNSFDSMLVTPADTNVYLEKIQQKNKIDFHEDGTIIQSLTIGSGNATTAAPGNDSYCVTLNQPFIYIIYDNQSLPLFMGSVDQPNQ